MPELRPRVDGRAAVAPATDGGTEEADVSVPAPINQTIEEGNENVEGTDAVVVAARTDAEEEAARRAEESARKAAEEEKDSSDAAAGTQPSGGADMGAVMLMLSQLQLQLKTSEATLLAKVDERIAAANLSPAAQREHPVDGANRASGPTLATNTATTGGASGDGNGGNRDGPPPPPPGGNRDGSTNAEDIVRSGVVLAGTNPAKMSTGEKKQLKVALDLSLSIEVTPELMDIGTKLLKAMKDYNEKEVRHLTDRLTTMISTDAKLGAQSKNMNVAGSTPAQFLLRSAKCWSLQRGIGMQPVSSNIARSPHPLTPTDELDDDIFSLGTAAGNDDESFNSFKPLSLQ